MTEAHQQPAPSVAVPDAWTAEQVAEFRKAWDEAAASGLLARHQVRWLPPWPPDVNVKAAAFAREHGSFSLHFDADDNYGHHMVSSELPWSVALDGEGESQTWAGHTAEEALDFAASDLAGREKEQHGR